MTEPRKWTPRCPHCNDYGFEYVADEAGVVRAKHCVCRAQRIGRHHAASAGILPKYKHCTFDNFNAYTPMLIRARDRVRDFAAVFPVTPPYTEKHSLFLEGLPGVGKTHLAVAALNAIMQQTQAHGLFCESATLLRLIRDSYNAVTQTTETGILRPILSAEILVLDDLGAERTTAWVEETLNHVVNARYGHNRATIFTTNYQDGPDLSDPNTLVGRIGHRMRSRLAEMCEFIDLDGADYRTWPAGTSDAQLIESGRARPTSLQQIARWTGRPAPVKDGKGEIPWPGGKGGNT